MLCAGASFVWTTIARGWLTAWASTITAISSCERVYLKGFIMVEFQKNVSSTGLGLSSVQIQGSYFLVLFYIYL